VVVPVTARSAARRLDGWLTDLIAPTPHIPPAHCFGGFGDVDIDQAEQLADYEADRDVLDPLICRCGQDPIACHHQ